MSAPPVLRDVYRTLMERRGDAAASITFDDGPGPIARLDVFVYRPVDPSGLTTFVTVGMASAPMPAPEGGEGGRAELWLSRTGALAEPDERQIAMQLANLAVYPWKTGRAVSWAQIVGFEHDFPTFPGCPAVFLAGPLLTDTPDWLDTCEGKVRVITVVPITEQERAAAATMPPMTFAGNLIESRNVFTAPDPAGA
ncbi:suppressor of fused domain protein [Catenulispora sp. NF23]|uniref:Suppressor of fused domain protein n=1 Tax=Catenulispora pinistramenti TaxID=2705254 RepID=A0ABS5L490_9ACTN|nr:MULTISPECIES: suppressor of fused domain protein [Catenulispora]MBS2539137.1 suppressor of fused domain protein [Catenulispora pinistramenti]MBS2553134.1 suppressor of fused domain protein [Catenulispora pinistramenti]